MTDSTALAAMTGSLVDIDLARLDIDAVNAEFEDHRDPTKMIRWLADRVPQDRLIVASAMTSVVLVDLVSRVVPGIEVLFIDTGYHFPETIETAELVGRRLPIRLTVTPAPPIGDQRYATDPDGCCAQRKVIPLDRALEGRLAWMSGVRRSDSDSRRGTPFVQIDRRGLLKLNPIAAWSDADVAAYAERWAVPVNPLMAQGYPSIGCWPCTKRPADGEHHRAGRWSSTEKTECGLHL